MAKDPKLDRLQAAPLFAECGRRSLSRLGEIIDTVEVDAGWELMREGSREHYAYVVESGVAEVHIGGETVAEIPEGEMIGEIGLLARGPATATIVAKTPMSLLVIPHAQFEQVLQETPDLGIAIARELAQRLRATDSHLH